MQYFGSSAHCTSIDNETNKYVLLIFRANLFLELTLPFIPRTFSKLLEGTLLAKEEACCDTDSRDYIVAFNDTKCVIYGVRSDGACIIL